MIGNFKKCFKHLKKICVHKFWVCLYCFKCGIYWRGIKHDLSKLSFKELKESIKYYQGTSSPINAAKADKGYSEAWMHHKGRNDHHYEYWTDNYDLGTTCIKMPFECVVEMLCDYLGAARAYEGKNFSFKSEWNWWINKRKQAKMHSETLAFIDRCLGNMMLYEDQGMNPNKLLNKHILKFIYNETVFNCTSPYNQ